MFWIRWILLCSRLYRCHSRK